MEVEEKEEKEGERVEGDRVQGLDGVKGQVEATVVVGESTGEDKGGGQGGAPAAGALMRRARDVLCCCCCCCCCCLLWVGRKGGRRGGRLDLHWPVIPCMNLLTTRPVAAALMNAHVDTCMPFFSREGGRK